MNRITAFDFLIALVHLLHPFPSLSSSTVSAPSSMPRKWYIVCVNQRHHVKRRHLPHNEPPVSLDDIADVDLQLWINSPSHTSSGDVSLSIEHEHSSQTIWPPWTSAVARSTDDHDFSTSRIAKLPCSEQADSSGQWLFRLCVTVETLFQDLTTILQYHRVAISYESPACIAGNLLFHSLSLSSQCAQTPMHVPTYAARTHIDGRMTKIKFTNE